MATTEINKPNGPVAAALLAGGIGSAVLGLATISVEASAAIKTALNWYNPVGSLMGKSSLGIIAFFLSWVILNTIWKGKETNFSRIAAIALVLVAVGLIFTFPPVWHLLLGGE
ncbi:MAG: hypothetical protein FD146_1074 [Anaerolineaceae bacterium]|nr:MAG: hypothetical protein FD146_1074 [Anaerolineaceae bacterium]